MKSITMLCILLLFCLCCQHVHAQSNDDIGALALTVIMPSTHEALSRGQIGKLRSKILSIATTYGLSGHEYASNFVIYPTFEVYDKKVVEGVRKLTIVDGEFNLFVKQLDNGLVFSSYNTAFRGSGFSASEALNDALSNIESSSDELERFLSTAKSKIIRYYETQCDTIIQEAYTLTQVHFFSQALGTLLSIPTEASSCHARIPREIDRAVDLYLKQNCRDHIRKSRAAIANDQFDLALEYLTEINPLSSCYQESLQLIGEVETQVDQEKQRRYRLVREVYSDMVALEQDRIDAAVEIARLYYQSRPLTTVSYTTIIR